MGGGKARPAAESAGTVHDKTIINQIMLKFRPIAPKPAGDGDGTGSGDPTASNGKGLVGKKRSKRKYVRINKSKVCVKHNEKANDESVVTLQLLPVTKDDSPSTDLSCDLTLPVARHVDGGLRSPDLTGVTAVMQEKNWGPAEQKCSIKHTLKKQISITSPLQFTPVSDLGSAPAAIVQKRVVQSWVTMECVTDGCENQGWLGSTDTEKVRNLEEDTCPGFLFDGVDVVQWVNLSYRRMVVGEREKVLPEVVVGVVVKGRFPAERGAFTCRVRMGYYRNEGEKYTVTVPCDVWKMEYGGFACRLDVKAALSLGR